MKMESLRGGSSLAAAIGTAVGAALIGLFVGFSPPLAAAVVVLVGGAVAVARFGAVGIAVPAIALLPWMVILEGVLPAEVGTLTAAIGTGALLYIVAPLRYDSQLIPVAAVAFIAITLAHAIFATDFEQVIQAAKYMIFPSVVLAVTSRGARVALPALRRPVLGSCAAAMVFHLGVIAAGLGSSGTYYGAGEKLGFAAQGPHALALMSMIIAAAGLTVGRTWLKVGLFGLGAVPAVLTGVRSALLGIIVALLVFVLQSQRKLQAAALLGAIVVIAFASGALDVITTRFAEHSNEFSSFASAGSGRGEIWTVAFEAWGRAGPWAWLFGTGLRSIVGFELYALGTGLVGHSDIVEVLVQIGFFGFVAWIALWVVLLRARLRTVILLPIISFGVVNGSLEYVAPLTAGLFLAAACVDPEIGLGGRYAEPRWTRKISLSSEARVRPAQVI
jgi:hypothetical protein